jgi:hypothetical protein
MPGRKEISRSIFLRRNQGGLMKWKSDLGLEFQLAPRIAAHTSELLRRGSLLSSLMICPLVGHTRDSVR